MFEAMDAAIEGMEIPADGAALVAALALRDRLDARITEALAAFDGLSLWDIDGATSLIAWLRDRGGRSRSDAARTATMARALRRLPVTTAAYTDGTLSRGQVEAIVANLSATTVDLFATHEAGLIPTLAGLSVDDTGRVMEAWKARALHEGAVEPEPQRALHLSQTLDGRFVLDGELDTDGGEVVKTALRVAEVSDDPRERLRAAAHRRADALVDICRFFLDHQQHRPAGRHRPHLNVVIDLDRHRAHYVDGSPVGRRTLATLVCDSALHRVLVDGRSSILDYGTATRTPPVNLWNALVLRDEHCRFPGCDRPATWTEAHHVVPFPEGGATSLDNLVLCCSRHHHRLHRSGWHAKLKPDATLEVTDPYGQVRTSTPPRHVRQLC